MEKIIQKDQQEIFEKLVSTYIDQIEYRLKLVFENINDIGIDNQRRLIVMTNSIIENVYKGVQK